MAEIKQEEFKFPDEVEQSKAKDDDFEVQVEDDAEVEVVDDTPEEDKNRTPMTEPPADVTDEELEQYSEGVKKRIQHFSKGYHEERRAKEAAFREREEAVKLAQQLIEENKKLQNSHGQTQQVLIEQAKLAITKEIEEAKRLYKEAYEQGDPDRILEAHEALTAAKIKADRVNNFKPTPLQAEKTEIQPEPEPPKRPQTDPKVSAWHNANPWFGKDQEMTALALAVHQKLVESGVSANSDEYFERINSRMRQIFPDAFPSEKPVKKSPVVAPATRSTAPKKIVLTRSQVNIATRLGLTKKEYALALAEQMRKENV